MKPILLATGFGVIAPLWMSGCGDPKLAPIKSALESTNGNFELFVSNQSFATTPIDIRVSIDGTPVVQRYFDVGNQHNWRKFGFSLSPGEHSIMATSVKGKATIETNFSLGNRRCSAILDYWYYPKNDGDTPRQLSFQFEEGTPLFQ
jgi:hypothetical protein